MIHVDLSHTPGLLYAVAYWLSSTFYIQLYGSPFSKGKKFGISAGFLALIAGFMTLTDGVSAIGFFPCMGVTVALIFFYIRIATHMHGRTRATIAPAHSSWANFPRRWRGICSISS